MNEENKNIKTVSGVVRSFEVDGLKIRTLENMTDEKYSVMKYLLSLDIWELAQIVKQVIKFKSSKNRNEEQLIEELVFHIK